MSRPLFPTDVQSVVDAAAGPQVDGARLRPGDMIDGPSGGRVVVGTGRGADRTSLQLFDPGSGRQTAANIDTDGWRVRRQALGVASTLDGVDAQQVVAVAASDPETGRCQCRWGSTPLGGTYVVLDGGPVEAPTARRLRERLDGGPLSASLTDSLTDQIEALAPDRSGGSAGPQRPLRTSSVPIPTGERPPVANTAVAPGDRFVTTPDGDPMDADRRALTAGRCVVVLPDQTLYDIPSGTRQATTGSRIRALQTTADSRYRLLGRDCYVDPIGTARTQSIHVYRLVGNGRYLLASDSRETDTPALEHPLALSRQWFDDIASVVETLREPDRIGGVDQSPGLRERCRVMARRLEDDDG